ncbi:hypothetical protein H4582DRAFT_2022022, partial [Lactarius indigo]
MSIRPMSTFTTLRLSYIHAPLMSAFIRAVIIFYLSVHMVHSTVRWLSPRHHHAALRGVKPHLFSRMFLFLFFS